jgi:hypothetical protein
MINLSYPMRGTHRDMQNMINFSCSMRGTHRELLSFPNGLHCWNRVKVVMFLFCNLEICLHGEGYSRKYSCFFSKEYFISLVGLNVT